MINVCFDESECGALKMALRGEKVTFSYTMLEIGKIAPQDFELSRKQCVDFYFDICSSEERAETYSWESKRFEQIISAAKSGEDFRIWVATSPHSKCGYYHLIYSLQNIACKIFVVEMPKHIGTRQEFYDRFWGEVSHKEMAACVNLQRELTIEERDSISQKWLILMEENAELRINLGGELTSVPIDYFDDEIMSYVPDGKFIFVKLLGLTLQNCIHRLDVAFVAFRIKALVEKGQLKVIKSPKNAIDTWRQTILKRAN